MRYFKYLVIGLIMFPLIYSCSESENRHVKSGIADTLATSKGPSYHPSYVRLLEVLEKYEQIASDGGWPEIKMTSNVLKKGNRSEAIKTIKERLVLSGDLSEADLASEKDFFDDKLQKAVETFQQRHGIHIDGIVGAETASRMNVPVESKIADIKFSLEGWKQLPYDLGEKYVFVNIPEFRLQAYENKEVVLDMKVVVGKAYDGRATPVFNDTIEYLEFNPFWNVPQGILRRNILPKAKADIGFLERGNFEIVHRFVPDAVVYENTQENLALVEKEELYIRQKPGPNNSMGRVKFMFPNEHFVYLHDTPKDELFYENKRAFSNGCIRVEKPADLAVFLLQDTVNWDLEAVKAKMQGREQEQVYLDEKIPIYIIYWTAFVDEEGLVNFREDVYEEKETTVLSVVD